MLDRDTSPLRPGFTCLQQRHPCPERVRLFVFLFHRWFIPFVYSRIHQDHFRIVLCYLYTDWKCNIDCHYCWGRIWEPRFDPQALMEVRKYCMPKCSSTCYHTIASYYDLNTIPQWLVKHARIG